MGTIVVGVDGSENSHDALAWAAAEARLRGAVVRLIHSWTFPAGATGADGMPHADLQAAAEKVLDEAVAALGDQAEGVTIEREIANESAARALVEASESADLIVVGSRGLGGFSGLLLGSVTQQVAHHAKCPVVIVPHAERR
jgi:nucleotide-binding universal stress UspA family protein